ncbi:hypothetical protein pb186bvf_008287 [Paramecium bursaria]
MQKFCQKQNYKQIHNIIINSNFIILQQKLRKIFFMISYFVNLYNLDLAGYGTNN